MPDALGARMKEAYEFRARTYLPRRSNTVIRLDGRCFSGYTRGLSRPYDQRFMDDMTAVAVFLCQEIQGCRLAYTQSDEISLILTDYQTPQTQAWFNGNVQKMVSVSAALATAKFNELRPGKLAVFDSRAFTIPDPVEVHNYLVWRQLDATRNSINMAAQAHFSHRELHGKSSGELQEMLWSTHGVNWNDYDPRFKRGTVGVPVTVVAPVVYVDRRSGLEVTAPAVERRVWTTGPAPMFTKDPGFVLGLLADTDAAPIRNITPDEAERLVDNVIASAALDDRDISPEFRDLLLQVATADRAAGEVIAEVCAEHLHHRDRPDQ